MKVFRHLAVAAAVVMTTGCVMPGQTSSNGTAGSSGNILGDILGGSIGNVITSVIGAQTVTRENLMGSWRYSGPGAAFTSDQLLAKAGGEVAAAKIKEKAAPYYQQLGFSSSNTQITFNQDGTFTSTIAGKSFSGQWTFDDKTYKVTLQGVLLNINCYAKRNVNGVGLLFEAKKLLTIMQTMAALSGNQTIQTVGDLSKSYDGLRLGFDFTR